MPHKPVRECFKTIQTLFRCTFGHGIKAKPPCLAPARPSGLALWPILVLRIFVVLTWLK